MVNSLNTQSSLAMDTQSLSQLRLQARQSPDQALKLAAQQFESVFMNMMLKSMRDATPQDGMMDSDQTRMFTGMLDQQLAQNLSGRGIGLADMMVKQLGRQGLSTPVVQPPAQSAPVPSVPLQSAPVPSVPVQSVPVLPSAFTANTQQDFVNRMLPHAMRASADTGVPPQLMLGQAALESGWGKREITMADGSNSYNVFGIKANAGWHGKVAEVMTTEYKNGVANKQVEKFRAYSSYTEAFKDYAGMMSANPRYAAVMQQGDNPAGMAQAVQKSGYATDPKYAEKLVNVMRQMNISG